MSLGYGVVVIGAGPAGAVTAFQAARGGASVLLVDRAKFPRDKVCGGCLNARAQESLFKIGLGPLPLELGAPSLSRLRLRTPGRVVTLPLDGSVSVSRSRFDAALVNRARLAGAQFLDGTTAVMGPCESASRLVELRFPDDRRTRVRAAVVVLADGLAGTARRAHPELSPIVRRGSRVGAGTFVEGTPGYPPGMIQLATGRFGYVGTVRLEDGRLDVAAALDARAVREAGPGALARRILDQAGAPSIPGLEDAKWFGTPALTRRSPVFAGERFFVVGDASGYVEPFTGEGMAWAIEFGAELGERLPAAAAAWTPRHAHSWSRLQEKVLERRQLGCRAVAATLRRPSLTAAAIGLMDLAPRLAAPLVRHLTQPVSG